ncbi:5'-AMP-activated protein kinase, gamma subunit [Handroanthus impetiginosus]|uniref:5'-AMP-activated protein kinase, gamma subunit n=1 Tax=Handroanthus impetiginosus TaxID=429701 RepID=A0A2G9GK29_9LAMI|nr:5'-AMP-activated protein kinase, gamma subunit [Handroanthus impetiginosus]
MVQIPFTWRYGGHEVFLSGSFNGWSERLRMVLLEGSETTFQRIIDLPPGCYQYKFLVDGTWQVDPQQICDPDEYGTMNNMVLVSRTELTSRDFNAEAFQASTSGSARVMPAVGSSSGGSLNDPVLQASEEEMDVFRQVLSMHMLSSVMYELIPISGKVIALDVEADVEQAFHVMYDLGLTVVPLWDEHREQMTGMLTASDFILILLQLHRNRAMFANEESGIRTISSWKSWKFQHHRDIIATMAPLQRRPLIYVDPDESFAHAASRILQNNISAVPIIHSVNGSWPRLLHVACLSGILKSVCSHFRNHLGYLTLLRQPVGYLPVGTWAVEVRRTSGRPLLTLRPNNPLISALILLLEAQISSIPIVDNGGIFVNLYSRSDITSLAKDNIYTRIQLNQITVSQALELSVDRGRNRYKTCTRFDSLYRVMELLFEPDVRRVIVVEASSLRLEGIITLRDIFEFFLR